MNELVVASLGKPERCALERKNIDAFTSRNAAQIAARETRLMWQTVVAATIIVMGVAGLAMTTASPGNVGIIAIFGVILTVTWNVYVSNRLVLISEKVRFVEGVCAALVDEIAPETKIRLHWDTSHYNDGKVHKTGTSPHGNTKTYHKDRWLKLKCTLADGSRLKLRRQRNVKVKKGTEQKTHRRIHLALTPNQERYGQLTKVDFSNIDTAVKEAVRASFHDPPEQLFIRSREREDVVDVVVHQWDAEFLPEEITAIIAAFMDVMEARRTPDGAW